jgi:hypothetical protein
MRDEILNLALMTTEEKTAEMYRLGREGKLSRREIAMRLGLNRNNVCRKLWMAGLTRERAEQERQRHNLSVRRQLVHRKKERPAAALPEPPKVPVEQLLDDYLNQSALPPLIEMFTRPRGGSGIGILALKPSSCRWVIKTGDQQGMAQFCGETKTHGSYCAEHAGRCYVQR